MLLVIAQVGNQLPELIFRGRGKIEGRVDGGTVLGHGSSLRVGPNMGME
jgi:hypothetical protein